MGMVTHTIRMRERRRQKDHRRPHGRLGLGFSTALSLLAACLALGLVIGYTNLARGLPSLESLPALLRPPDGTLLTPTRLYDRSGAQVVLTLEEPGAAGHQYLFYAGEGQPALPETLVKATVAAADPTFWQNPGYSLQEFEPDLRPTLAQRLVSDLLFWDEPPGLRRTLRERWLAAQIVARYGREQVMEWYLNSAQYGEWIFGADAAARAYFGKSASQLTLAEAAALAAVADAPAISPFDAPGVVLERQRQVIGQMLLQGLITAAEAQQALDEKVTFQGRVEVQNLAPAFTDMVLAQLEQTYPQQVLGRGGLKIITTLDYDLQVQASCAVQAHLQRLAGQPAEGLGFDGAACQAALLLPTLNIAPQTLPDDLTAMVVVLAPDSGQVLAMVGQPAAGLNPAARPGRPSGTILTPFFYLAGFTRGLSPATLLWDVPPEAGLSGAAGAGAPLLNLDGAYHGPVRARTALANDYLAPLAQALEQTGIENALRTALQMGVISLAAMPGGANSAKDLLSANVTLLEIVQAYGTLANRGLLAGQPLTAAGGSLSASAVIRLESLDGVVWEDWSTPQTRPIASAQLTYLVTHILSDEPARWPSLGHPNPLEIGRPAGVKTGISLDEQSAWTVGYLPEIVVGVWAGPAQAQPGEQVSPLAAAGLWHALMQYAARDLPSRVWEAPAGISAVSVCDPSGLLPTDTCPRVVGEVFLTGSEPVQEDNLYRSFQVNRETGLLATVFTPLALVEPRVYLVVPPQAAAWAQSAGLETPPNTYDVIFAPTDTSPEAQVDAPQMFAYVRGEVTLTGSAGGEDFAYYRLQVGQGLNPQAWIQLGENMPVPVTDGTLGVWDTRGLNGLYVVRLQVVFQDQRIQTAVLQVSVDNQPPVVTVLNPLEGESYSAGLPVLLQANASDDLALAEVAFYVDGQLVTSLPQPPFTSVWTGKTGTHTLLVRALDMAGNQTDQIVSFTVK